MRKARAVNVWILSNLPGCTVVPDNSTMLLKLFQAVARDVLNPVTHDYSVALSRFELAQYQGAIDVLRPYQTSGKADETRQVPQSRAALYILVRAYQAESRTPQARPLFRQLRSQSADAPNEIRDTRLNDALTGKAGQEE